MRKKDVPLAVWKELEDLNRDRSPLYTREEPVNCLLLLRDADPESDFFFQIVGYGGAGGSLVIQLAYAPTSGTSVGRREDSVPLSQVKPHFSKWLGLLDQYEQVSTPFDDPLLRQYEAEFAQFFEVSDEDADYQSFDWVKQQRIDHLLAQFIQAAASSAAVGDMDLEAAKQLEEEAQRMRTEQASLTKRQVSIRIRRLLSKARKASVKFTVDVLKGAFSKLLADVMAGKLPELVP